MFFLPSTTFSLLCKLSIMVVELYFIVHLNMKILYRSRYLLSSPASVYEEIFNINVCDKSFVKINACFITYFKTRGAPDSDFYYPAGYRICRISEKNRPDTGYFIQFEILNARMSAKIDQIYSFRPHHILAICEVICESRHIIIYSILYIMN